MRRLAAVFLCPWLSACSSLLGLGDEKAKADGGGGGAMDASLAGDADVGTSDGATPDASLPILDPTPVDCGDLDHFKFDPSEDPFPPEGYLTNGIVEADGNRAALVFSTNFAAELVELSSPTVGVVGDGRIVARLEAPAMGSNANIALKLHNADEQAFAEFGRREDYSFLQVKLAGVGEFQHIDLPATAEWYALHVTPGRVAAEIWTGQAWQEVQAQDGLGDIELQAKLVAYRYAITTNEGDAVYASGIGDYCQ